MDELPDEQPARVMPDNKRHASDLQRLINYGHQSFVNRISKIYSPQWFRAWIQIAAANTEHMPLLSRVATDQNFKIGTDNFDRLAKRLFWEPPRSELVLLVCAKGGNIQSERDRITLENRQEIAKQISKLLKLIDKDREIRNSLSGHKLYALAFNPLCYHLRNAPNAPSMSLKELREAPTLEAILAGLEKRLKAKEPFGLIHPPSELAPKRLGRGAQQTYFEQVMKDRFRQWFGKPCIPLCANFASAAFGKKIDALEVQRREASSRHKRRKKLSLNSK